MYKLSSRIEKRMHSLHTTNKRLECLVRIMVTRIMVTVVKWLVSMNIILENIMNTRKYKCFLCHFFLT